MSTGEQRGAEASDHGAETRDYGRLFHDSYLRCVVSDQDAFFGRFYELFTAAHTEVSRAFARTDMDRQISMLQESLLYMIDFANSKVASDRMRRIAQYHGSGEMNILPHLFDLWMDCLVDTVRERDTEFDSHVEAAWRVSLAPGIAFVKLHCSP